jgi:hypothetical protein
VKYKCEWVYGYTTQIQMSMGVRIHNSNTNVCECMDQCCKCHFGEYIAKGLGRNLSEISSKISKNIEKYQRV